MTDHFKTTRDAMIDNFVEHAAKLFARDPARNSVLLAVAQYWNDSANDEVHGHVIASTRTTPVWPHECDDEWDENGSERRARLAGEACWICAGDSIDMSFYGGYGDSTVGAFETFCREGAHQSMEIAEAYTPFAIARRGATGVDIEIVGHAQRPPNVTVGSAKPAQPWPDLRARELFEQVSLHAADDGPRAVLADYLLERYPHDPRGEAIAYSLARDRDETARVKADRLIAAHGERWLFPLGDVIAGGCAHFERGFLARCDVYAPREADRDRVRDAPAWGTVHTIRFAPGSRDLLSPAMTALREVGPIRDDGLVAIAKAGRPWAIERLHVAQGAKGLVPFMRANTLPRLSQLTLSVAYRDDFERLLPKAPWRAHLARVVFVASEYGALSDWRALRVALGVPELAVTVASHNDELSWEIGFRADDSVAVRAGGYFATTAMRLAELLGELPKEARITLASSAARVMTDTDVTWLRDYTDRAVAT